MNNEKQTRHAPPSRSYEPEPEFDPQPEQETAAVVTDPDVGPNQTAMPEEVLGKQTAPVQEPKQEDADVRKRNRLPTVVANENKYLQAQDLDGRFRLANAFFKSGMCPKGYKDAAAVFAGMELACELNLKPFTALKNIAVINGSPSIWGDLPLSLVRRSGQLEKISEVLLDKDYNEISWRNKNLHVDVYAAVCITRRKGNDTDTETVFTMDMAKNAGLLGRDNVWKTYPRRMIQMRARSQNLKDAFGDILMGIEIAEYDYNYMPQRDVTPEGHVTRAGEIARNSAEEINKTLEQH